MEQWLIAAKGLHVWDSTGVGGRDADERMMGPTIRQTACQESGDPQYGLWLPTRVLLLNVLLGLLVPGVIYHRILPLFIDPEIRSELMNVGVGWVGSSDRDPDQPPAFRLP